MPYGSKELHFGHIGGVFVHADVFARFMRDRIGADNVIFVSGTDCYGSPIVEKFRELKEAGKVDGTIEEFVESNHSLQKETLDNYLISLSLFGASALGECGKTHTEYSDLFFRQLYESGSIKPLSTAQFFDEELGVFLNGRQVVGRCPIAGCKSEHGYADECSLGHQYFPEDLIAPVSTLSGTKPVLKNVSNWYFDMNKYFDYLVSLNKGWEDNEAIRDFTTVICDEFLKKPAVQIKQEDQERAEALIKDFKYEIEVNNAQKNARIIFSTLEDREAAVKLLANDEIRYRTGKTIVPFRLSGNIEWGVPVPELDGMSDLTFWVWPESLWAPISFTQAYLKKKGLPAENWKDWWCDDENAKVFQFIGEDNIYFYALAEMAMFKALMEDATRISSLPDSISGERFLLATYKSIGGESPSTSSYKYYFSTDSAACYFTNPNGESFKIEPASAKRFLASSYSVYLYDNAVFGAQTE